MGNNNLTADKEVYLRTELWQKLNPITQIFNKKAKLFRQHKENRRENLEKLKELLPKIEKFESLEITQIEIERELGNFEKAKTLIENLDGTDRHNFQFFIEKSIKLTSSKSTRVFEIKK